MTVLAVSLALLSIGLYGVMTRRDIIGVLASVEVMMAGPLVLLVAAGATAVARLDSGGAVQGGGTVQSAGLLVVVIAAAEAAVGLALLIAVARSRKTTRMDELTEVQG